MTEKTNVLLIDDNNVEYALLKAQLQVYPQFNLFYAEGVQEASTINDPIDIVLLDLNLWQTKGADSIRAVMQVFKHTPVIVYSAYISNEIRAFKGNMSVVGFYEKSGFVVDGLVELIKQAVEDHKRYMKNISILKGRAYGKP